MTDPAGLIPVATVAKTHGIHGELNCTLDVDYEALAAIPFVFVRLDGLMVPFAFKAIRPRGRGAALVTFEDLEPEAAGALVGLDLMARPEDLPEGDDYEEDEGFYLTDLIGYEVVADGIPVGVLEAIDDTTANILMLVKTSSGKIVHIPAADEFFVAVEPERRLISLTLPQGLF